MQRKWLVLGVLLLSLTCHRANAQVSAEIGKASAAPTIDGLANDAIWADATVHDTSEFFPDNAPDNGAADLDIQWRALWDDNNLYFLAEMTDDRLVNDDTSIFFFNDWQDDSLELYIDAQDLNVPDYQPANAPDTPAFQLTVLSGDDPTKAAAVRAAAGRGDGNPTTSSFTHGINSYADVDSATKYPQNTDTSTSTVDATNPNKWTFEAAIPWTLLFDTPANIIATRDGDFGFGVAYNDNDNETGRDSQYMWATPTYDLWMRSDTMPTVKLVDGGSQGLLGDYNKNG
ncbi:MAG: hypothetical protein KDA99_00710, partial [Planctomycetales bacterium]|nr:hypothetical protein [Planctomycetales bacterium]